VAVLKSTPADFRVAESVVVPPCEFGPGTRQCLRLVKSGHTTFEAVQAVAEYHGVDPHEVGYAGLKDEDAITEQFLTIPGRLPQDRLDAFGRTHGEAEDRWMRLTHHCHTRAPLHPGDLDGNSFRIVLRGLTTAEAQRLAAVRGRDPFLFVNYYDTQRFGVPAGPKQTHLIGAALRAGDDDRALRLLRSSGSPESLAASDFTGPAKDFFAAMDQRRVAFFRSAQVSDEWNTRVRALVPDGIEVERDGMPYVFPRTQADAVAVLLRGAGLRCQGFRWRDGVLTRTETARPPVVQAQIRVVEPPSPEWTDGSGAACRATVALFLPSGCYATMAVAQYLLARAS
jgi:tRNA pseudouridine13 synthase